MQPDLIVIPWEYGEFTVLRDGAMCAPATFNLSDGRSVQPFAIAPWQDDGSAEFDNLPPLLKRMRGEWACVPFGMPDPHVDLPPDWMPDTPLSLDLGNLGSYFHGPGSNVRWLEVERHHGSVTLEAIYPESHPIERVVRRITGASLGSLLEFELEIHPRQNCSLPIGVHPTFRLPVEPMQAVVAIDGDVTVHTYPIPLEPGVSKLPIDTTFKSLQTACWADGSDVDLTRHPLSIETEELVQVSGVTGRATLDNLDERYRVTMIWDASDFGSCALWMSNGGRQGYPWNGRFKGLGIEMVSAPFDLGVAVANSSDTPFAAAGVPCFVEFKAGEKWMTKYSIGVSSLSGEQV